MAEVPLPFAGVLQGLRTKAGLTQEELAEAAGLTARTISYLERGAVTTPHKDTVRLLADALQLTGPARAQFEMAARGRAGPGGASADGVAATRTLPRDVASFTGRQRELAELADAAAGARGAVSIHAIGGMAGVGKTAFAVHAAHRLADRFPGGQIFLPLHGHTPGQRPVGPADALASLLLTIGVPAARIPAGLEARMALWRDRAVERLLLILDDAADSEQVRPLLPGAGDSLVLVTSRRRLTALEDATTISLDALPMEEAAGLLVRLAVRPGLSSADPAVAEITRLCGFLPLAIGMLARQLHHHPAWTASGRAAQLATAVDRLELLATENVSVAAAFDLSYADLTPEQQRLFRRLGLHPGSDVDSYAAAALDGTDVAVARHGLEAVYDQHLLTEPTPGRYRMHDLIREHARALAGRLDSGDDRDKATERLMDYYQQAAARADALLARPPRPAPPSDTAVPALASWEQALAWARFERSSLLACLDRATAAGQDARVIALMAGLGALLWYDGPWDEAITRHTTAMQAARRLGDRPAQGRALTCRGDLRRLTGDYPAAARDLKEALGIYRDSDDRLGEAEALLWLGRARRLTGDYPGAARDLEEALSIHRGSGNRLGQAYALTNLGCVRQLSGDYPGAVRDLEEALDIHRDLGSRLGQANALTFLGRVRRLTDDYPGAARDLQKALDIYHDLGDRDGQAEALNEAGTLSWTRGDFGQARSFHQQALDLARQISSAWDKAHALAGLGRCDQAAGRVAEAEDGLRQALEIFQQIGATEADGVAAELDALSGRGPGHNKP